MRRSSRRPGERRSDSRNTAPTGTNLIAVPDGDRPLSEGLVVEASVVARLFRIRVLALGASVVIAPAQVRARTPADRTSARRRPVGNGLKAAERILDDLARS